MEAAPVVVEAAKPLVKACTKMVQEAGYRYGDKIIAAQNIIGELSNNPGYRSPLVKAYQIITKIPVVQNVVDKCKSFFKNVLNE